MTDQNRQHWDNRYLSAGPWVGAVELPAVFQPYTKRFPTRGKALDLACGQGRTSVWLAQRGLNVMGVDISAVSLTHARDLARRGGVEAQCCFVEADLDDGLPLGVPADLIICNRFRDRRLDRSIVARLAPGGLLAICVCSEVGAAPGPFRAAPGELVAAFSDLDLIAAGEDDGLAWLLALVG